jgi:hypothetical protein
LVEKQAAYLLISMRQRMLGVPQAYAGRLVGLADAHAAAQVLRQAMIECLEEAGNRGPCHKPKRRPGSAEKAAASR